MYFNRKAIISKQIVRACINCHVSQRAAFDSLRIAFAVYFRRYRRAFDSLSAPPPPPGILPSIRKKRQIPGGQPWGEAGRIWN